MMDEMQAATTLPSVFRIAGHIWAVPRIFAEMPDDLARRDHGEAADDPEAAQRFQQQHERNRQREADAARAS